MLEGSRRDEEGKPSDNVIWVEQMMQYQIESYRQNNDIRRPSPGKWLFSLLVLPFMLMLSFCVFVLVSAFSISKISTLRICQNPGILTNFEFKTKSAVLCARKTNERKQEKLAERENDPMYAGCSLLLLYVYTISRVVAISLIAIVVVVCCC
jgi:hypothetical protein